MNDQIGAASFFASKTLSGHLLRGAGAAAFIVLALKLNESMPALALVAGLGTLVMLRGCPMCWTIGLIETLARRRGVCKDTA